MSIFPIYYYNITVWYVSTLYFYHVVALAYLDITFCATFKSFSCVQPCVFLLFYTIHLKHPSTGPKRIVFKQVSLNVSLVYYKPRNSVCVWRDDIINCPSRYLTRQKPEAGETFLRCCESRFGGWHRWVTASGLIGIICLRNILTGSAPNIFILIH